MNKNYVKSFMISLLLASLLIFAGEISAGGQIQDAIDNASPGDTINVATGTYYENVVITKSLSLIGAGKATTIIDGSNSGNTITITASDVTVSGFTVTGGYASTGNIWDPYGGIVIDGNGGTSAITNIVIDNNIIDSNAGNGIYVSAAGDGGSEDNIKITNCTISNNGGLTSAFGGISVTYGFFNGSGGPSASCDGLLEPYDEWRRPKNVLIERNELSNNVSMGYVWGIYINAGAYNTIRSNSIHGFSAKGLLIAASMTCTAIPVEYTTVENNNIYNNARNGIKLVSWNHHNTFTGNNIYGNGYGAPVNRDDFKYGFLFQDGNDNTIQNNTITGNALGGMYLWGKGDPSYTWYSTTNNTITGNIISGHTGTGGHGIYIPAYAGYPNSGFLDSPINCNFIENNFYGLENANPPQIVDALYNWWGNTAGPNHTSSWDYMGLPYGPNFSFGNEVSDYVLYDPYIGRGGFVSGGGTIWSEKGDYVSNPNAEGMANFGFVAKYKKGAEVPAGNTNFVFSTGDLHFQSSEYDRLVVAGNTAKFKGVGTIDGASGSYKFIIWADDDPDTFRIKIWEEANEIENIVYDNGSKQAITGGNIFIHKEKKK